MSDKYQDIISKVEALTVVELAELVKALEEKFGVSAAAMAVAAPGAGAVEAKDTWNVVLKAMGDKKIEVIKVVREVTGLGLTEAKTLVESAPKAVKEGLKKEEAEEIKKKLETAGATASLE